MKKLYSVLLLFTLLSSCGQNRDTDMKEFDENFSHTVYFWLKNPDSQEDRKAFETSLKKFLDHSAYAKTRFIGTPPRTSRDVVDGSFTYSLIATFESAEAQQNYQDEAPHKLFVKESEHLWNKVIVYDSQGIELEK
ncbi:Dabb family protein [Aggregatimonas sangjinii]|uniref:Dabb family protein n=1 Tax=Aggregatimonas sangjinii TaxID=2583587 RepID=A0A5B7SX29_9FLAO|nr:Dabb family protein [Aggregatimonas sangjinii]QCX01300.1 Dabb family protein [Aggregatimonas sangjinii]